MKNESVTSQENSTIAKCVRNLFTHNDSFLQHQLALDQNFNLEMLRSFSSNSLKSLTYPSGWIIDSCGKDGGKAIERLKSHSYLRSFLDYCVDSYSSSNDFQEKKKIFKENLQAITKQITNGKMYKRYNKIANNHKQMLKKADKIMNPSKSSDIANCVRVWYNSDEKVESDKGENIKFIGYFHHLKSLAILLYITTMTRYMPLSNRFII